MNLLKQKMEKKVEPFSCKSPCGNCPYRKDAPLRLWHKEEFAKLLENDNDYIGKTYMCHKKNGSVCIGWLIDQDKRDLPSIALRLSLASHNVTRKYLDSLKSEFEMFKSIKDMVRANFPELLKKKKC